MKILFIESLGEGGITHYTFNLANALAKDNCDIYLFTAKQYEFEKQEFNFYLYQRMFKFAFLVLKVFPFLAKEYGLQNIIRRVIKIIEYPINIIEAILIAKKNKIKIIHIQSVNEIELLMILAFKLFSYKIIYTIHNVFPRHAQNFTPYQKLLFNLIYKMCNHLIIHTESGKSEICSIFNIIPEKISVIPHGDYTFFVSGKNHTIQTAKKELGIDQDVTTILFFGAIRPNKGLDNVISALSEIKRRVAKVKLMIVGELCEDYKRYQDIIDNSGVQKEIYVKLDYIANEDIYKYFSAADIVVLPYNEVSGSGVLQIAYAFGKPVVATNLDGFREVIEDGKNGYLVPTKNIEALAKKISILIKDKLCREKMGKYSKHLAEEKFSWNSISDKTKIIYSHLVTKY